MNLRNHVIIIQLSERINNFEETRVVASLAIFILNEADLISALFWRISVVQGEYIICGTKAQAEK